MSCYVQRDLYEALALCLSEVPCEVIEKVTSGDLDQPQTVLKGSFVRCYLCASGIQSVNLLNKAIESVIHLNKRYILFFLKDKFFYLSKLNAHHY